MKIQIFLMALMQNPDAQMQCAVAGCSSQLCVEASEAENIMSTCEWRNEYACYKLSICAKDPKTLKCGWQQTPELKECLSSKANTAQ